MSLASLSIIPVVLIGVTSVFILVSQNWRTSILALALQYLAVFWLVGLVWPLGLAAVKLVAGWIAGAVVLMAGMGAGGAAMMGAAAFH